jgi:predicted ABC-type ATPase
LKPGELCCTGLRSLFKSKVDFAFDTTLSTKSYRSLLVEAKAEGYKVVMIFFWLQSSELAKERVKERVKKGGHNIPEEVIERRYNRGLQNLFKFIQLINHWAVWNNSEGPASIIAQGNQTLAITVYNDDIWSTIKRYDPGRD